jgi:hypothetical protein
MTSVSREDRDLLRSVVREALRELSTSPDVRRVMATARL